MRQAYRILNYLLSLEVVIQAAVIAWGTFGIMRYADDHGSVTHHQIHHDIPGSAGLAIHSVNGAMVIPALALALLVVSFFARVERGVLFAGIVFVLVALQAFALPALAERYPATGVLHGANAIAILALTIVGAKRASHPAGALAGSAY